MGKDLDGFVEIFKNLFKLAHILSWCKRSTNLLNLIIQEPLSVR